MPLGPSVDIQTLDLASTPVSVVMPSQLLGEIKERQPSSGSRSRPVSDNRFTVPTTGFPVARHRNATPSAFAKARAQQRQSLQIVSNEESRPPIIVPSVNPVAARNQPRKPGAVEGLDGDWKDQMQQQNDELLAHMTEEEKEREQDALLAQFGGGLLDLVRKAKARREGEVWPSSLNNISPIPMVIGLSSSTEVEYPEASPRQRERPPHLDFSAPLMTASPREWAS